MNSMTAVFDTLQYAKKLKEAGFTDRQAEVQVEVVAEIVNDKLATKQDISDVRRDIKELEYRLTQDTKELEYRLTIKVGGFLVVSITVLVTLMKLFHL